MKVISIKGCMGTLLTINIKLKKQFYFRIWCACQLFKLAGKILNCETEIHLEELSLHLWRSHTAWKAGEALNAGDLVCLVNGEILKVK